ncbi:MAG: hypothetical protein EAX86_11870 [Candidatus Heimdallarchaeota archaeon]|nr:hypothetical protein [Candidatus Heimdallarchaeota archaeon]
MGQIVLLNCVNIAITNQSLCNSYGVTILFCTQINVTYNSLLCTYRGIQLLNSNECLLRENIVNTSKNEGIILRSSSVNLISDNIIVNSTDPGKFIDSLSSNNIICFYAFLSNPVQGYDDGTNNSFYCNYWDDWIAIDNNNDGIIDSAYQIPGEAQNSYSFPCINIFFLCSCSPTIIPPFSEEPLYFLEGILFLLIFILLIILLNYRSRKKLV